MITRIIVPDVGATGGEVRLVAWHAAEGDHVAAGQPLFTLETDKATQDIEAFAAGYLRRILAAKDATVELGAVVALITDTADEPITEVAGAESSISYPLPSTRGRGVGSEGAGIPRGDSPLTPDPSPPSTGERGEGTVSSKPHEDKSAFRVYTPGRILASPLAKRLAREHGIDLAAVAGSGSDGEIHKRDVLQKLKNSPELPHGPNTRRIPLSPMRRAVAARTAASKTSIPHFYATITVDMTDALAARERLCGLAEKSGLTPPTVNDLVLRAAAVALRATPELNACYDKSDIVYFNDVDIGMAVGVTDGVLVPVLRRADQNGLWDLARTAKRLRERAVAGMLSSEEMAGGALTVSNLGMYGLDSFTAIINPPQAAALAVGAARPQPAVYNGQLAVRTLMQATLSVDHRVADGVVAARFLGEFRRLLETPRELLSEELGEGDA